MEDASELSRSATVVAAPPYALKRATDIIGGTILLVLALPFFVITSIAILIACGSPVIFRAPRIGRDGRVFTMYKFRTMVVEAELQLENLGHLNVAQGMIKIPHDPRVTGLGRVLRKFSFDELPQLINVVRGDMSLVGPRPHLLSEIDPRQPENQRRLSVRPGLTGLWQISARSNPSLETRVHYDLEYLKRCSLGLDLRILVSTIARVVSGDGDQVSLADIADQMQPSDHSPDLIVPADVTIEAVSP